MYRIYLCTIPFLKDISQEEIKTPVKKEEREAIAFTQGIHIFSFALESTLQYHLIQVSVRSMVLTKESVEH